MGLEDVNEQLQIATEAIQEMRPQIQTAEGEFRQGRSSLDQAVTRLSTIISPLIQEAVAAREEGVMALRSAFATYDTILPHLEAASVDHSQTGQEVSAMVTGINEQLAPVKRRVLTDVFSSSDALTKLEQEVETSQKDLGGVLRFITDLAEGEHASFPTALAGSDILQGIIDRYRKSKNV